MLLGLFIIIIVNFMLYIAFPADEKIKIRLDAVCKSLGKTHEEWFETALRESEFDVLVRFLGNPEEATGWKWDV